MVPLARIERATSPLPRECSTTELQRRNPLRGRFARAQRAGAGEGNRTLVVSLEGFCSTIELHPRFTTEPSCHPVHTANPRRKKLGGGGWIRTNVGARPTDLQSAPFNHSGTPPNETGDYARFQFCSQTGFARIRKTSALTRQATVGTGAGHRPKGHPHRNSAQRGATRCLPAVLTFARCFAPERSGAAQQRWQPELCAPSEGQGF